MAYTKQNFEDGQVLTADHLNHIEVGLVATNDAIEALEKSVTADVSKEYVSYDAYNGNQLLVSGGTNKSDDSRIASDLIPVLAGEVYYLTCSATWGHALYVVYKSDAKTVVSYGNDVRGDDIGTVYDAREVTMPVGAAYLRVGCNLDIQPNGHSVAKKIVAGKWSGLVWAAVGDSLTEKNIRTSRNYLEYIADSTSISVVNMGIGGTGYKNGDGNSNAFYQRISETPTNADVVTIFGSFNDLSTSIEIGDPTDTGTDTLCGCINTTIDNLFATYPLVRLGIITPTPWVYNRPDNTSHVSTQYVDAIINICRLRGIPCLDLFRCSGLRPWEESYRELAYSKDGGDGTHPDEVGHAIIAPRIKAFLETLLM